jgi:hypothetical protein
MMARNPAFKGTASAFRLNRPPRVSDSFFRNGTASAFRSGGGKKAGGKKKSGGGSGGS